MLISAIFLAAVAVAAGGWGGQDGVHRNGRIVFQRLDPEAGKIRLYTARPDGRDEKAIALRRSSGHSSPASGATDR